MNEFENKIFDKEIEVNLLSDAVAIINGKEHPFEINKSGVDLYYVFLKNKKYICKVLKTDDKVYEIFLNNNRYKVECKTKLELLAEELTCPGSSKDNFKVDVFSPMPGLILKILKNNGDEVKQGEPVLILEAMKMENEIVAPKAGLLSLAEIKEGITIEKNVKLFEIKSLLFEKKY